MWAGPEWLRIAPNRTGHDWLVGDLHGKRPKLIAALIAAGFDFDHDRLFATGDLIDRGENPLGTLGLLDEPWFHPVLGNHDRMLLTRLGVLGGSPVLRWQTRLYAQAWDAAFTPEERTTLNRLVEKVRHLPLVMVVDGLVPFWVVHAQRPMAHGKPWTDAQMLRAGSLAPRLPELTWSRRLARDAQWSIHLGASLQTIPSPTLPAQDPDLAALCADVAIQGVGPLWEPEVGLTYTGHTIVPHPVLHRSHLMIDGGAYKPDGRLHLLRHDRVVAALASTIPALPLAR